MTHYFISTGEKGMMFTLREHHYYQNRSGMYVHTTYHVANLTTDPDTAIEKAKRIAKEHGAKLDNYSYIKGHSLNEIKRKQRRTKEEMQRMRERRQRISDEIQTNYWMLMWSYNMARSCSDYDRKQKEALLPVLDTDNRITLTGTIKTINAYDNPFTYYDTVVFKALIELDSGHRVFGTVPSYKIKYGDDMIKTSCKEGDRVTFDAKLEKPKDFDGVFYYYKRPTKVNPLTIREVA